MKGRHRTTLFKKLTKKKYRSDSQAIILTNKIIEKAVFFNTEKEIFYPSQKHSLTQNIIIGKFVIAKLRLIRFLIIINDLIDETEEPSKQPARIRRPILLSGISYSSDQNGKFKII